VAEQIDIREEDECCGLLVVDATLPINDLENVEPVPLLQERAPKFLMLQPLPVCTEIAEDDAVPVVIVDEPEPQEAEDIDAVGLNGDDDADGEPVAVAQSASVVISETLVDDLREASAQHCDSVETPHHKGCRPNGRGPRIHIVLPDVDAKDHSDSSSRPITGEKALTARAESDSEVFWRDSVWEQETGDGDVMAKLEQVASDPGDSGCNDF
jgi:hypothetical protein